MAEDSPPPPARRRADRRRRFDDEPTATGLAMSGVPGWVRAVAVVGIPGTIAIFLVYQGANQLPKLEGRLVTIEKQLEQQRIAIEHQTIQLDKVYRQLQRICSNTAKTDDDRQRCFD